MLEEEVGTNHKTSESPLELTPEKEEAANISLSQEEILQTQIEMLKERINELQKEQVLQIAEKDNFYKRQKRHFQEEKKFFLENYFKELLPVLDSLEEALNQLHKTIKEEEEKALWNGLQATLRLFQKCLTRHGIEIIDPLHTPFDPACQHVMKVLPMQGKGEENDVVEVLQKGYLLHHRLLRAALVCIQKSE